ncbi:hypothetical protein [Enterobacter hormaechei]|uniref:hypothetical protein n=1 Tax=Enterobacter hormaechei TaxID=158836 RepID=UPI000AAA9DC8|nr:hypothetical protein [Enterobacter hormaechei]HAV1934595.1 hypothetical protein [Enterobacter hormaechei subsp. steigerwaltii]
MEISSLLSMGRALLPVFPLVRKWLTFESFFSLPCDKQAEAIKYIDESHHETEPLKKYQQELTLTGYGFGRNRALAEYAIRFYLHSPSEHKGFARALFSIKSLYEFQSSELRLRKGPVWFASLLMLMTTALFVSAIPLWNHTALLSHKVLIVACVVILALQYGFIGITIVINYARLRRRLNAFNFFITLYRLKKLSRVKEQA